MTLAKLLPGMHSRPRLLSATLGIDDTCVFGDIIMLVIACVVCLPSTVLSLWSQLSPTPTGCFPSCDLGVISCGTIAPDGVISWDEDTKTAAEVRN